MRQRSHHRNTKAFTLVESLVSVLIGAIITGIFLDTYSKMQRTSATSQNEACANAIAQELVEESRAIGFNYLAARTGQTYDLLTYKAANGQSGPVDLRQDPVLLDLVKKLWHSKVVSSKFPGTVTYKIETAPGFSVSNGIPDAITISVITQWSDGEKYVGTAAAPARTVTNQLLLTKTGVNKWTP